MEDKASKRALEAYPSTSHYWNAEPDRNAEAREFYKQGYQQAEKDLELSWEDIASINDVVTEMLRECGDNILYDTEEEFCKEVLKRFKDFKERKEK